MRHLEINPRFIRVGKVFFDLGTWQEIRYPGVAFVATRYALGMNIGNRFFGLTW